MRSRLLSFTAPALALFVSAALSSCTSASTAVSPAPTDFTQNWQIQTGSTIASSSASEMFLAGAMNIQGSQVTALFKTKGSPCPGFPQPATFKGTFNASSGALTLNVAPLAGDINVQLNVPSSPTSLSTGTLAGEGDLCALVTSAVPSVGMEIPSLLGGFNGKLSATNDSGTATLSVSQAPTASPDSTFALTGTLTFTNSSCTNTIPVTGTINGATYTLASAASANVSLTLSGLDNQGGAKLPTASLAFPNGPCNAGPASAATYTGDLSQQ